MPRIEEIKELPDNEIMSPVDASLVRKMNEVVLAVNELIRGHNRRWPKNEKD